MDIFKDGMSKVMERSIEVWRVFFGKGFIEIDEFWKKSLNFFSEEGLKIDFRFSMFRDIKLWDG